MWKRLLEKWRLVADAIDGMDDPQGDNLFALEKRVRRLEGEVEGLRKRLSIDTAAPEHRGT
jgi:hypothetical protein